MDKWTAGALIFGGTSLWLVSDAVQLHRARNRRVVVAATLALLAAGGSVVCLVVRA